MAFNSAGLGTTGGPAVLTCGVWNGSTEAAGRDAALRSPALATGRDSTRSTTLTRASVRVVMSVRSRECVAAEDETAREAGTDTTRRERRGGAGTVAAMVTTPGGCCDARGPARPAEGG